METEKILNKIFAELTEKAYDGEYHVYNYKITNQIIRANIEALMEASKISSNGMLKVTSDSKENNKESEVAVCVNCGKYESVHSANRRICPGGAGHFKQTDF